MLCRWTLTSTLLFTHLQFMSSHYYHHQSPILLLDPLWEGETLSEEEQKEERSLWANAHLLSDLHMELIIKQTVFDRFFTPPNNVFWTHLSGADGQSKTLCNDTINCVVFFIALSDNVHPRINNSISWKLRKNKWTLSWGIFVCSNASKVSMFTLTWQSLLVAMWIIEEDQKKTLFFNLPWGETHTHTHRNHGYAVSGIDVRVMGLPHSQLPQAVRGLVLYEVTHGSKELPIYGVSLHVWMSHYTISW